ncbi:MAG: Ribosomal RNA large subunit methyltransferase H [Legionellaceae bacterium]
MKINLIAVGKQMPNWVEIAYQEYAKRLPPEYCFRLIEINAGKRNKNTDINKLKIQEGELILNAIPKGNKIIALDVLGQAWDTEKLSKQVKNWLGCGQDISLLIGGPDGLSESCLKAAEIKWSLSPLTLPHPLIRIIVAEQLYRAWTILKGHPYHR